MQLPTPRPPQSLQVEYLKLSELRPGPKSARIHPPRQIRTLERNLQAFGFVVPMVVDAILDVTARGELVLDPFLGGGSTLIACERTGRACRGIEIDPIYVDACLRRIARHSGRDPVRADGRTFSNLEMEASHAK
jgi:DNA modification methylase